MSVPFCNNIPDSLKPQLARNNGDGTLDNYNQSLYGNLDHEQRDSSMFMMNQKLIQLSLANCDLNGNDHHSTMVNTPTTTTTTTTGMLSGSSTNQRSQIPNGNLDYILGGLRNKLVAIKQMQNDSQINYKDAQSHFNLFAQHCRHQLNLILHEMGDDLDNVFTARANDLKSRENQIENILFRIDQQQQQKLSLDNKNGNNFEEIVPGFDPELSSTVKNILESPIPSADIRLPSVDPAQVERSLRSLLVLLIKQPPSNGTFAPAPLPQQPFVNEGEHFVADSVVDSQLMAAGTSLNWHSSMGGGKTTKSAPPFSSEETSVLPFYGNNNSSGFSSEFQPVSSQSKQAISKSLQPKVRRERIVYYLKFGEQGTLDGQFAEPSGVAVNSANDDIFIADANNHRIQVFDKWGKFKFHFGEGKLKFPNRVAISRNTGDIVVSERPPVHQIQIYNKNGNFMCKFGSKHLRHPRGLAVDHKNRVIVVECKVMRVFIFNLRGDLLHSFDCSPQIQFPNAVAVSKEEEIFISDNRNHCVKVFSFSGEFLRQIGGQGTTNYPIGVCLNETTGHLLVVDNYNNLNVTIFRTDGQVIGAYESLVKHKQCLDVALFGDNSIVVTSKDLQVYLYRLKDLQNGNNNNNGGGNNYNYGGGNRRNYHYKNSNSNNH